MGNTFRRDSTESRYLDPSGLYPSNAWDNRVVRRMILSRELAPRYPGSDSPTPDSEECPICFLHYTGGMNRSRCCRKPICTECYLQVRPPMAPHTCCPFCMRSGYSIIFTGPLSNEERQAILLEEQKVIELRAASAIEERESDLVHASRLKKHTSEPVFSQQRSAECDSQTPHSLPLRSVLSNSSSIQGTENMQPQLLSLFFPDEEHLHMAEHLSGERNRGTQRVDMDSDRLVSLSGLEQYMIAEGMRRSLMDSPSSADKTIDIETLNLIAKISKEDAIMTSRQSRNKAARPHTTHIQSPTQCFVHSADTRLRTRTQSFVDSASQPGTSNGAVAAGSSFYQDPELYFDLPAQRTSSHRPVQPEDFLPELLENVPLVLRDRIPSAKYRPVSTGDLYVPAAFPTGSQDPVGVQSSSPHTLPPPFQNSTLDDLLGILSCERRRSLPKHFSQPAPQAQPHTTQSTEPQEGTPFPSGSTK